MTKEMNTISRYVRRHGGRLTYPGVAGREAADALASNGVIHLIDRVVLPAAKW